MVNLKQEQKMNWPINAQMGSYLVEFQTVQNAEVENPVLINKKGLIDVQVIWRTQSLKIAIQYFSFRRLKEQNGLNDTYLLLWL